MIEKEYTPCAVCGSAAFDVVGQGTDYEFNTSDDVWQHVACTNCNHLYLNPRPKLSEAGKIYPTDYYPPIDLSSFSARFIAHVRYTLEKNRYAYLERFLGESPHVWDIGSGNGRVLLMLRKLYGERLHLTAIDITMDAKTKKLFQEHAIHCVEGLIEELPLEAISPAPQLVILTQVIEHLWQPAAIFKKLAAHQKKGGTIFIETPNPQSFCRRFQGPVYWGGYHRPRHLNLFSRSGLERIAHQSGYTLKLYQQFTVPAFWIMGIRNRLGLNTRGHSGRILECISLKNIFILALFTCVEHMCGLLGLGQSNHRFIFVSGDKNG